MIFNKAKNGSVLKPGFIALTVDRVPLVGHKVGGESPGLRLGLKVNVPVGGKPVELVALRAGEVVLVFCEQLIRLGTRPTLFRYRSIRSIPKRKS